MNVPESTGIPESTGVPEAGGTAETGSAALWAQTLTVTTAEQTHALGAALAAVLGAGGLLVLTGELGAGETNLTPGLRVGPGPCGAPDREPARGGTAPAAGQPAGRHRCCPAHRERRPGLRVGGRRRAPHHHHPRLRAALDRAAGSGHGRDFLMLILAIDTSAVASAALVSDDALEGVVGSFSTEDTRSHAEVLAPGIERLLADAGVTGADIDAIVVGVGPGPFTGLRSGIATARTLAFVWNTPLHGMM